MGEASMKLISLFKDMGEIYWTDERIQSSSKSLIQRQLFLVSFLILFTELSFIRWIPSNVRYMGFFMNFILMATFLGMGAGILSSRRKNLWLPPFPILLFVVILSVSHNQFVLNIPSNDILYYGMSENAGISEGFWLLPFIFTLSAVAVLPLGRTLGRLLPSLPPLEAYALDIGGSLTGIASFFIMSYFSLPPVVWFGVIAVIFLLTRPTSELGVSIPILAGGIFMVWYIALGAIWTPYYQVHLFPLEYTEGVFISVNGTGHQSVSASEDKENFYFRIYDLLGKENVPDSVLVIGAGTGSDVAIALQQGVKQITAVEIDPKIYEIGKEYHPENPYQNPGVDVIIQDGRYYLNETNEKYDLIIFALPDSLTLTSAFSSLRLESFLLTTESLEAARDRLTEDGVLVLYNYYREDWLIHKLAQMLTTAFDEEPFVTTYGAWGRAAVFVSGPGVSSMPGFVNDPYTEGVDHTGVNPSTFKLPVVGEGRLSGDPTLSLTIDDWPFVYMPKRTIPAIFLIALGMVGVISIAMVGLAQPKAERKLFSPHFFFLGVAFMLLETRSLVTFSLLFGSTWIVNSLVFFAILSSVLLAILINSRIHIDRIHWLYIALILIMLVNYVLPTRVYLNIEQPILRYLIASFVTFLPIFLANIIFSRAFKDTDKGNRADLAFGSNLLGSMVGGGLEYLALITGYQALLFIASGAYVLAFVFGQRENRRTDYFS
jgi:spermidine synthase